MNTIELSIFINQCFAKLLHFQFRSSKIQFAIFLSKLFKVKGRLLEKSGPRPKVLKLDGPYLNGSMNPGKYRPL